MLFNSEFNPFHKSRQRGKLLSNSLSTGKKKVVCRRREQIRCKEIFTTSVGEDVLIKSCETRLFRLSQPCVNYLNKKFYSYITQVKTWQNYKI